MERPSLPPSIQDLPLRLTLDGEALAANWRLLDGLSGGAACGGAVKADGYGLGAVEVTRRLAAAGCRDFFVATWAEAIALGPLPPGASLSVLHGVRDEDMTAALDSPARPVLNTAGQVMRWKAAAAGRPCDVMIDTGMNRLGLTPGEATSGLLDGLAIDTLMSHLACADEPDSSMTQRQRDAFVTLAAAVPARRRSLCNSAGIFHGSGFHLDLVRPGIALYGATPHPAAQGIRPVARIEAQVLQTRSAPPGSSVGYGATRLVGDRPMRLAILNIGYADGYLRGFSERGMTYAEGHACPVVGRVSMDLVAVDIGGAEVAEGDWLEVDYDLPRAAAQSGLSQYELLTGLGGRYQRRWL
jgi:alanine racemase